ncbi:hypothetical protein M422DRAFT_38436 [Sphaerobolus stellatus SS14]|uniref:Uncharacterized protein n=1 Tax=Sphaerobolus stellatus (strain SS14) TaxID=990650 RepID=A0A0C9TVQ9_SPHS4|nr:hypothetical protein M422DRAFT_38436 [Sphaerobolus stellatus SS14]
MHFVARIDRRASGCKLGPYGNQEFAKGKDADALNKLKFIAAFSDISDAPKHLGKYAKYPEDMMSWFEMSLNEALNSSKSADGGSANVHSFVREDSDRGTTYILGHTPPIIPELPQRTTSNIGKGAIGTGIRNSPSKQARKRIVLETLPADPKDLKLVHLFDPESRFTSWAKQASEISVNVPNFRDADGLLITPRDYETKLPDKQLVEVTGSFRMWEIPPKKKQGFSDNGARAFNFMIQKLQILPATVDHHAVLTSRAPSISAKSVSISDNVDPMDDVHVSDPLVNHGDDAGSSNTAANTGNIARATTPQPSGVQANINATPGLSGPLAAMDLVSTAVTSAIAEDNDYATISEGEYEQSGSSPSKRKQDKQHGSTRTKNARVTRSNDLG